MKALLVIALIHGLVPAFGELLEATVHYATRGHLAHSAADEGDLGDQGDEHGCSPTRHFCACCAAQPLAAPAAAAGVPVAWSRARRPAASAGHAASRTLDPPFRPPIA